MLPFARSGAAPIVSTPSVTGSGFADGPPVPGKDPEPLGPDASVGSEDISPSASLDGPTAAPAGAASAVVAGSTPPDPRRGTVRSVTGALLRRPAGLDPLVSGPPLADAAGPFPWSPPGITPVASRIRSMMSAFFVRDVVFRDIA